jgi:hypothetical protein
MALYPPEAICQKLYTLHPYLRLAWHVRERQNPDEINPGDFAIIQLYHVKDAGTPDNPNTYLLHWAEAGEGRGPIFNRKGGTRPDWPEDLRRPIYVARLGEYGITKDMVMSGEFLEIVKYWLRPSRVRLEENARAMGKELKSKAADIAGEQTDYLWYEANKSDADRIIMTREDGKEAMAVWAAQKKFSSKLEDYYLPPGL